MITQHEDADTVPVDHILASRLEITETTHTHWYYEKKKMYTLTILHRIDEAYAY